MNLSETALTREDHPAQNDHRMMDTFRDPTHKRTYQFVCSASLFGSPMDCPLAWCFLIPLQNSSPSDSWHFEEPLPTQTPEPIQHALGTLPESELQNFPKAPQVVGGRRTLKF